VNKLKTSHLAIISSLVALCVATNYALVGVPNVKVMDFIVFVGGFCFGITAGALVGILSWTVYGVLNPYGFVPQIWLATMFSESIYGVVGGLLGKNFASTDFHDQRVRLIIFFAATGFILTMVYDVITNIVYAWTLNIPVITTMAVGAPFTVLHEISNTQIFGIGSAMMVTAIRKIFQGERFGISSK